MGKHEVLSAGGGVAAVIYNNVAGDLNGTLGDDLSIIPAILVLNKVDLVAKQRLLPLIERDSTHDLMGGAAGCVAGLLALRAFSSRGGVSGVSTPRHGDSFSRRSEKE